MVTGLTPQAEERIAAAIAEAERQTAGEIVCTLSTEPHRYVEWVLGLAALIAFLLPALATLAGFGPERWAALLGIWRARPLSDVQAVELFVAAQALTLLLATLALWWSPFAQRWAPLALRRDRVHELALKQFLARGIHLTRARTGVLVHVSLEDHVVEVIADAGIHAQVAADVWADAAAALLAGLRRGDLAQGLVDCVALVGAVLAHHFPPTAEDRDELPNRLLIV